MSIDLFNLSVGSGVNDEEEEEEEEEEEVPTKFGGV
jgi:hypothetical protein